MPHGRNHATRGCECDDCVTTRARETAAQRNRRHRLGVSQALPTTPDWAGADQRREYEPMRTFTRAEILAARADA